MKGYWIGLTRQEYVSLCKAVLRYKRDLLHEKQRVKEIGLTCGIEHGYTEQLRRFDRIETKLANATHRELDDA